MEALDAIFSRRSIRKYTDTPVTDEEETLLLRAAMVAPNTVNTRAWSFIVVRSPDTLAALSDGLAPNAPNLKHAPMCIVICGDLNLTVRGLEDYWTQDCSNAATTLLLAAHAIGLGAVWYGAYPNGNKVATIAKLLNLPRHIIPLCVISVGHPAETKPNVSQQRYEPHKVHHETWNGKE